MRKTCQHCGGDGYVTCGEWQEYWEKWDTVQKRIREQYPSVTFPEIDDLTEKELERQGIFRPGCAEEEPCPECEGYGYVLTKEGIEFFSILRKYISAK